MALTLKDIEENYRRSMVGSERAGNIRTFSRFQETGPYMRQLLGSENAVTSLPVDTPKGIGPRLSATGNAIAEGASILWDSEEASGRAYNPNTGRVDVIPSRTAMLQEAARTAEDMQRGVNAPGVAPVRAAQPTSPLAAINARAGIYQGGQPWSPGGELAGSPLAMEGPPTGSLGLPGFMEVPRKPTSIEHPAMATNAAGQMVYNPAGDFARYEGGTARGFFPGTTPAQHYELAKKTFGSQFGSRETTGGSPAAQAARARLEAQDRMTDANKVAFERQRQLDFDKIILKGMETSKDPNDARRWSMVVPLARMMAEKNKDDGVEEDMATTIQKANEAVDSMLKNEANKKDTWADRITKISIAESEGQDISNHLKTGVDILTNRAKWPSVTPADLLLIQDFLTAHGVKPTWKNPKSTK